MGLSILEKTKEESGFSMLITVFFLLGIMSVIIISLGALALSDMKQLRDMVASTKAYYMAEGALEDAIFRLKSTSYDDPSGDYILNFQEGSVSMSITTPPLDDDRRDIVATADSKGRVRKEEVTLSIQSTEKSFFYAIQAGNGHFYIDNNALVNGNIYSNGDIIGVNKNNSIVYGNAIAVGTIDTVTISDCTDPPDCLETTDDREAKADILDNCVIEGDAYYTDSISDCDVSGSTYHEDSPPESVPFPDIDIGFWKTEAADGGLLPTGGGDYTPSDGEKIGPNKIDGNLTIEGGNTVYIEGPIWVTGGIIIENNATLRLTSGYEDRSGIIIADGKVELRNGGKVQGSGDDDSYLLVVSTDFSLDDAAPAIDIRNNSESGIFYAPNGMVVVGNSASIREITGLGIHLNENCEITYETGLESVEFTTGPGGSWQVTKWHEVKPGD